MGVGGGAADFFADILVLDAVLLGVSLLFLAVDFAVLVASDRGALP
jgi:hypothetical protein